MPSMRDLRRARGDTKKRMDNIRLVYARSVIARDAGHTRQRLCFMARVANLAYEKRVEVMWAGEDGVWQSLPARYQDGSPHDEEYWLAEIELPLTPDRPLPGNVEFAVRYHVLNEDYWDNNDGRNHTIQADCGVQLAPGVAVLDLGAQHRPTEGSPLLPIAVAVDARVEAQRVTVHWTTDDWHTTRYSSCRLRHDYWDAEFCSNARNPNHYGTQIWDAQLEVERTRTAKYRIACEAGGRTLWDDAHRGRRVRPAPLRVLALNLHCYQEEDQQHKFRQIAAAIDELAVDVVCFQEVAELWNDGKGDWASNSARIINEHLRRPYRLVTDWSHLGFDRYREGVAILSRHPIVRQEARYVSRSHDPYSIHSRKVVLAQLNVPFVGLINVFSAHLSWWDDGFAEQFGNLRRWARSAHTSHVKATLLCGDFNIEAGSRGYELVLDSHEYEDGFLAATRPHAFVEIFGHRAANWREHLREDRRIDYLFLRKGSGLRVVSGRELFTERDFGRVSDHTGYLLTLAAK
jgi:maltose 6'-phosphate phosphatase